MRGAALIELVKRGISEFDCACTDAVVPSANMDTAAAIAEVFTKILKANRIGDCMAGCRCEGEFVFCVPIGKFTPDKT